MISELQKGNVYLRCHNRTCPTKTIREDEVERQFAKFLAGYDLDPRQAQEFREEAVAWINEEYDDVSVKQAEMAMAKLEGRLKRLEDKYIDDKIDENLYARKRQEILLQRKGLEDTTSIQDKKHRLIAKVDKILELGKTLVVT